MKQHMFRKNIDGNDISYMDQYQDGEFGRRFQNGRFGFDWFIDNRNTLTVSQGITAGDFNNLNTQEIFDLNGNQERIQRGVGRNDSKHNFRNYATQVGYKRTFAKEGRELTADVTYNRANNRQNNDYSLQYYDMAGNPSSTPNAPELRYGTGGGNTTYLTAQVDFVTPLTEKSKLEAGLRSNNRRFNNILSTYGKDFTTGLLNTIPACRMITATPSRSTLLM